MNESRHAHAMRTVVDAIVEAAPGGGTLTTIRGGEEITVPWAQVHDRARRVATFLSRLAIGRGDRIGLLGDSTVDMMVVIQAAWLCGAAITVLPPASRRSDPVRHKAIIADAGIDMVLADFEPEVADAQVLSLPELVSRSAALPAASIVPPEPGDLAILQYTSGSTSQPRGVPVTHGHLAANLEAITAAFSYAGEQVRMFSWLPLYHDMGLIAYACQPMAHGWPLVLQSPVGFAMRPMSWLEGISRYRSTVSGAPDFAFRLVTSLLAASKGLDLSSLQFLLCGAEPISAEAMRRFAEAGRHCGLDPAAIIPAYGLAEATLAVSISPPGKGVLIDKPSGQDLPKSLVRLGSPVPGVQVRITDPGIGDELGPRGVGQIEVRGPSVVGHYWGQPPPPPGTWFGTGDLGYLADGELVVCGRIKDIFFCAGRNVYPQDVELAATRVPAVRPGSAVAFGVPDDLAAQGDRLIVAIEVRGADTGSVRREVAVAVNEETGMRPAEVVALLPGRIPRTSSGKLRRAEARRRYLCGELTMERAVQ